MEKEIFIPQKIIPGGQAIATAKSGKKVFLWNALPGEKIFDYQIVKNKTHYTEAIATKIQNPSKQRVLPEDDIYLSTSPWQIIDYDYELKLKQELVVEILREHNIKIDLPQILTDDKAYHYRNKMEYAPYWNNDTQKIELSFHQRGTHRKVPIQKSSIERPEIFQRATEIIDQLNLHGEPARKYQSLLLRCNQKGEVSGGLYENGKSHPIFNNLTDSILGQVYSYSPNGFFQINLPVYEMALIEIKKHIKTDKVLDLYAGVGTIGLSVARDKMLTLVEIDKFSFDEMARNIIIEDISEPGKARISAGRPWRRDDRTRVRNNNILAIYARSEEALDYIAQDQTVILDPPRSGCDKKLIDKLNEVKPRCIIYLSCSPATQARDIKLLLENYQIDIIKTFNFFPRTPHIENLVVLNIDG